MWTPKLVGHSGLAHKILVAIEKDIDGGRLSPGERLPTHRELSDRLQVALGTVTRAYSMAKAKGLLTGTIGRGTFVAARTEGSDSIIDLSRNMVRRDQRDAEIRSLIATLDADGDAALLDDEQDPAGVPAHRAAAAEWIAKEGFPVSSQDVAICCGVQHAMHAILMSIAKPGDLIVTESLTYAGIKALTALAGLRLQGLPIDAEGLMPQGLADACKRGARILYITPTLHNPTASTMTDRRRKDICKIVQTFGVTVLEDDVYGFLAPDAPLPLAAYARQNVYYLASTSKSIAPGLRVGYAVCPSGMASRIANTIRTTVWETSPMMSGLVTKWIRNGTAARVVAYKLEEVAKRNELAAAILPSGSRSKRLSPHWWLRLPEPWRAEDLAEECRLRGVAISPASTFAVGRQDVPVAVRLCLGSVASRARLEEGLTIVAEVLQRGPLSRFSTT